MTTYRAARRGSGLLLLGLLLALWPACGTAPPTARATSGDAGSPPAARHLTGTIHEFPLPSAGQPGQRGMLGGLAVGPDGALWFTETVTDPQARTVTGKIGRMTPSGTVTAFPLAGELPRAITAGPDGALWFTEAALVPGPQGNRPDGKIGRITPAGQVREFPLPHPGTDVGAIIAGPDGALWFTEGNDDPQMGAHRSTIARITPAGQIREFPLPSPNATGITLATGPDGALWFTAQIVDPTGSGSAEIGRLTPVGALSFFPVPATSMLMSAVVSGGIATGPDGNLWFTEIMRERGLAIGRITPRGEITDFPLSPAGQPVSSPLGAVTAGGDGALWFTDTGANAVGRITLSGTVTEYPLPTPQAYPTAITAGPDGTLWFVEPATRKIGHLK